MAKKQAMAIEKAGTDATPTPTSTDDGAAALKKQTKAMGKDSAPASPKKRSGSSAPSLLLALAAVVVALLALGARQVDLTDGAELQRLVRKLTSSVSAVRDGVETAVGAKVPNKYHTTLVHVAPRVLLDDIDEQCADATYAPAPLLNGRLVPVTEAMEVAAALAQPPNDRLFFMLNGRNEGVYVSWNAQFACTARAARAAAIWLGADADEVANGVRLYTQMGFPIRDARELAAAGHLAHILLDFQIWQWPGIRKGHKYVLENGVTLTTVGLSPKVLDVQFFLTQAEADEIRARGEPSLNRSKVDGANSSTVVSKSRTSHTAFLDDSEFTREFRRRSALVARLPSPSYVERLQLVRYAAGEFYRQHLDTFHSREFLPKDFGKLTMDDYKTWANWAAAKLREIDPALVPEDFREGGPLFPDAEATTGFPNRFLDVFYQDAIAKNMFAALFDEAWATWITENVAKDASNMMPGVMKTDGKPHYLPLAVRAWELKLGLPELHYTFPKGPLNGVTHFFRWVRWAKERVTFLGDRAPAVARHDGDLFPKFTVAFQSKLLEFVLDDYSQTLITRLTNDEWYTWLVTNRGRNHVLFEAMQAFPNVAELAIRAWEARVASPLLKYKMPKFARHFHPQRYVTLFLYLNNETKIGGETVFPFSLDRYSDEKIERTGMDECSSGLAVPPLGLHASLFYVQTPEGETDRMSRHGGCPPHEGVKWGSNSFMWDSDADEGADLWTTK